LLALAAVAGWLVGRRKQSPNEVVIDELAAINRAQRLDRIAAENKAEIANALADDQYRSVLARIDAKRRVKAEDLRRHPGKRLLYLRRLARQLERRDRADAKRYQ
jgi:transposase